MELEQKHSRLDIASFRIFIAGTIIGTVIILVGAMAKIGAAYSHGQPSELSKLFHVTANDVVIGGFILGSCLNCVALGLGIAALRQNGRKKMLAILGCAGAFGGLVVLAALALAVIN